MSRRSHGNFERPPPWCARRSNPQHGRRAARPLAHDIARRRKTPSCSISRLVEDRIRDGKLTEADDSAAATCNNCSPAHRQSHNAARRSRADTLSEEGREAVLAKNNADEERCSTRRAA